VARAAHRPRPAEEGYNMVALVIMILLLNIAVATALPMWSTAIRREKEEELIFRGFQYAEAIRVFQQRHGRLPVKLEELIKVEPRSIRQLWTDPITGSDDWGIVLSAGGNRTANLPGQGLEGRRREKGDPGDPATDIGLPGSADKSLPKGPIIGVFSRSTEDSVKVLFDQERYSDWKFTVPLITGGGGQGGGNGGTNGGTKGGGASGHVGDVQKGLNPQGPRFGIKWLGRPFRQGLEPGNPANQPNGLPPSDLATRPIGNPVGGQNPKGKN